MVAASPLRTFGVKTGIFYVRVMAAELGDRQDQTHKKAT